MPPGRRDAHESFAALQRRRRRSGTHRAAGRLGSALEQRVHIAKPLRKQLVKAFPEHWSFMLGEIALYSFVILVLTGTYLTFFYDPSDAEVHYRGGYALMRDVGMSKAFESTISISFDVRGGLLIRQIHHWAALLFFAAIMVHMCRIFFTGAFRKPRDLNWLIGFSILGTSVLEGFAGYSLPDDLISGSGLRVAYSVLESIPVVGTWLASMVFGGQYPGHDIFQRLYIVHVLLFPGIIAGLVAAHLVLIVRQKHTDFRGVGRTETTVAGERLYPIYAAKSGGFFFITAGTLAALAGFAQINPIWLWGPYEPFTGTSNSQPDFFAWFLEGSLRLFPPWAIRGSHTVSPIFWSGLVIPSAMFLIPMAWPFLERFVTRDHRRHNVLQRPRDAPVRTAIGVAALTFATTLSLGATDDILAGIFRIRIEAVVWFFRICTVALPLLTGPMAYRICRQLQQHDRLLLRRGIGTGQVRRRPDGTWAEVTRQVDDIGSAEPEPVGYAVKVP